MTQSAEQFFKTYALANASSDVALIGSLYADNFLFAGPNGAQHVRKEDFLKVLPKMKAHYASLGHSETRLHTVEATALNARYLLAKVGWKIGLIGSSGVREVDAAATYVLMRGEGETLSIVFQLDHQDLAEAIADRLE